MISDAARKKTLIAIARRAVLACRRGFGPKGPDPPPRLIAAAYLGLRREPVQPLPSCAMEMLWFQHEGLGNSSYLVEVAPGKALAVDPDRRVRRYIDAADKRGWQIVAAIDTHVHADFITGGLDLRALTGAEL